MLLSPAPDYETAFPVLSVPETHECLIADPLPFPSFSSPHPPTPGPSRAFSNSEACHPDLRVVPNSLLFHFACPSGFLTLAVLCHGALLGSCCTLPPVSNLSDLPNAPLPSCHSDFHPNDTLTVSQLSPARFVSSVSYYFTGEFKQIAPSPSYELASAPPPPQLCSNLPSTGKTPSRTHSVKS